MSNMTSESKDIMMSDDCVDSPSFDEANSSLEGSNSMLKKGPWTSAEDAILVDYVNKHGEGNWNAVQKHSGLSRCGKSCRLRWANHLRPDLKKGAFTPGEEHRIIELHAKMGNKWARMAAEHYDAYDLKLILCEKLDGQNHTRNQYKSLNHDVGGGKGGRTDNEIKNFWNTRIKRRQRAGLPIYPPDICSRALIDSQKIHNMSTFSNGNNTLDPKNFPTYNLDIPSVEFEYLELNQSSYPPPTLLDIASSTVISQALGTSCSNNSLFVPPINDFFDSSEKIFGFSSSLYDDNKLNADLSSSSYSGSHALLFNGNFSSSWPASKLELPSLQYSSDTQAGGGGSWCDPPSSPLPSLESVDTLIRSPPSNDGPTQQQQPDDSLSPRNNGLLESVLYESHTKKKSKKNSWHRHQYSSDGGSVAATGGGFVVDGGGLTTQLRDAEWGEMYGGDPNSPLGHSAISVFSEYTTPVSGSSFDDPDLVETVQEWNPKQYNRNSDISNQMKFSRPDFLLGSNWFGPETEQGKHHSTVTDAIGQLLGEDCNFKYSSAAASSPGQGGGHSSCEWE
ncbi:hypothetical protein LguiB_031913 [Lonicera macranthoides]